MHTVCGNETGFEVSRYIMMITCTKGVHVNVFAPRDSNFKNHVAVKPVGPSLIASDRSIAIFFARAALARGGRSSAAPLQCSVLISKTVRKQQANEEAIKTNLLHIYCIFCETANSELPSNCTML